MNTMSDKSLYSNANNTWYQIEEFRSGSFEEVFESESNSIRMFYVDIGDINIEFITPEDDVLSFKIKRHDFLIIDYNTKISNFNISKGPTLVTMIKLSKTINEAFNFAKHIAIDPNIAKVLAAKQPVILIKNVLSFNRILKLLENEIKSKPFYNSNEYMQNLLISMIFIEISREFRNPYQSVASIYAKKASDYIHNNFEDDIKLDDIAHNLYIHPSYLRKLFKEQFNDTFIGYLTNVRIERAKELLSNSSLPIVEISESVGIKNREHFQRIFAKIVGVTPGNYRKIETSNNDTYKSPKGTHKRSISL